MEKREREAKSQGSSHLLPQRQANVPRVSTGASERLRWRRVFIDRTTPSVDKYPATNKRNIDTIFYSTCLYRI